MKITDIIDILRNDNKSYLWDLPRPQWKEIDFYNLNQIKQGKEYKNQKKELDYIGLSDKSTKMQKEQLHRMKPIRRKSDGKIFSGMIQICRETGLNRSSLSLALNNRPNGLQKYRDEFEFIN